MNESVGLLGEAITANHWDRMDGVHPDPLPVVSVVIPYFMQQSQLDRTLLALQRQSYPQALLDIIVVDDGSPKAPIVARHVRVIRQEDLGFRLAAARNAGAKAARGTILCFLDADTVPEPGYVRELVRLPSLVVDAVTVGRRRHADLSRAAVDDRIELMAPALELDMPAWLSLAYERTRDLLDVDHRSYRYLIGAVLACSRAFFDETGGFDESFSDYGGEDWEWGYRAWLAGAVLAHVPAAVAWHDGPDWSGRSEAGTSQQHLKNRETLTLSRSIPAPGSRGHGVRTSTPDVVVEIESGSTTPAALFICVDSILEALPHAIVVLSHSPVGFSFDDPRVVTGSDAVNYALARAVVLVGQPLRVDPGAFRFEVERVASGSGQAADVIAHCPLGNPVLEIRSMRARRRRARWNREELFPTSTVVPEWISALDPAPDLEAYLGGWN
ncbi:GT2 family glycosyltransferase [Salinibacterium sp. CAN_S4]|uniref:glycosyltransferase family 2 protein n=1 Tax=Salinibacterium sp. CAN_S4 TaxID=2787727 RepID=UPI001A2932E5